MLNYFCTVTFTTVTRYPKLRYNFIKSTSLSSKNRFFCSAWESFQPTSEGVYQYQWVPVPPFSWKFRKVTLPLLAWHISFFQLFQFYAICSVCVIFLANCTLLSDQFGNGIQIMACYAFSQICLQCICSPVSFIMFL